MIEPLHNTALDTVAIRAEFPILQTQIHGHPLVYLDSAASAQKPQVVLDAMHQCLTEYYANVHRGLHSLSERSTEAYESVRGKIANLINAPSPDEVVFTFGATMALNLIARAWGGAFLQEGDEILISIADHHANIVPWQIIAAEKGAKLTASPVNEDGTVTIEMITSLITEKTRIVALPHVSNVLGTVFPIAEVARAAHEVGAIVVVDGCQGVTHASVDVRALDCDFYVFSGHKLYGPNGIGILWGKGEILATMPPFLGGGDMIDRVTIDRSTYAPPPHRFEAGTPPIVETIGLGAAVDFIQNIGMDAIHSHEQSVLNYAQQRLSAIDGLHLIGTAPNKSGVISFTLDDAHPHDIATIIDRYGIAVRAGHHCAQPLMDFLQISSTVRASIGVYTTAEEFDRLAEALERAKGILCQ